MIIEDNDEIDTGTIVFIWINIILGVWLKYFDCKEADGWRPNDESHPIRIRNGGRWISVFYKWLGNLR